jgi:hypothetical protein
MISKLTDKQEARIPEYFEKWKKIGFSTDPIDRSKAKNILKTYLIGTSSCKEIIFCDSPMAAQTEINKRAGNNPPQFYPVNYWSQSGNIAAGYCAFYDFIIENLKSPDPNTLALWYTFREFVANLHYIWVFPELVVCSEKPVKFHTKGNNIHCDGGAAVQYADGYALYFLNGVSVPDWLAVTPRHKLDAKKFATLANVEVRREFVRKVGAEKLLQDLGSTLLDKQGDYELHSIDLGGTTKHWPYLKMLNPSIGVWHIEAVDKACKTVTQALAWRDNEEIDKYQKPEVLT